jgi:hypothetical protein
MSSLSEKPSVVTYETSRYAFVVVHEFCAMVRDAEGKDVPSHPVLGSRLMGCVSLSRLTGPTSSHITRGQLLRFEDRGVGWITDPVTAIVVKRPRVPLVSRPPAEPLILEL